MYTKKQKMHQNRKANIINMISTHLPNNFDSLEREAKRKEWSKASAKYIADKIKNGKDHQLLRGWELPLKENNGYTLNFPPSFPAEKRKEYEKKFQEAKNFFE